MPKIDENHLRIIRERGMLTRAIIEHPATTESGQEEFFLYTDDGRGNGLQVFTCKLADLQHLLDGKVRDTPFMDWWSAINAGLKARGGREILYGDARPMFDEAVNKILANQFATIT
jgi:hypothetical protein